MKRSSLVVALVTGLIVSPTLAAVKISTASEFAAMAEAPDGSYELSADIDLAGSGYTPIAEFSGSLDGAGHVITGLGAQPIFTIFKGSVRALTVDGTVDGANTVWLGDNIGVFCLTADASTFADCVVRGYTLKPTDNRKGSNGLFASVVKDHTTFERCLADAGCELNGNGFKGNNLGGFIGRADLSSNVLNDRLFTLVDCTNRASVVSTTEWTSNGFGTGGFFGSVGYVNYNNRNPDAHFIRCHNEGSVSVVWGAANYNSANLGGFVGNASPGLTLKLVFTECVNSADICAGIPANGVSGFVGFCEKGVCLDFNLCVNRGRIGYGSTGTKYAHKYAGGFVGTHNKPTPTDSIRIMNSANYGDVCGASAGGFLGRLYDTDSANQHVTTGAYALHNSANYGVIDAYNGNNAAFGGEFFGSFAYTTVENVSFVADNCHTANETYYGSMSPGMTEYSVTNCKTQDDAADVALAALNAVAAGEDEYADWRMGRESGLPELAIAYAGGEVVTPVVKLGEPTAAMDDGGRYATFSAAVTNCTLTTGTLRLVVNGRVAKEWPLAAGVFSETVKVAGARLNAYSFVAEGSREEGEASDSVAGEIFATRRVDWFDVDFSGTGYRAGDDWTMTSRDPYGAWSGVAKGDSTLDTASGTVTFVPTFAGELVYTPKRASEKGADVVLSGRACVVEADKSTRAADAQLSLAFERDDQTGRYFPTVCLNGTWTRFGELGFAKGAWVDYTVEADHASANAPRVRIAVDGETSDWLPVVVPSGRSVKSVSFTGGSFGDFGAFYYSRRAEGFVLIVR